MEHIACYLKDIHFKKKSGRLVFEHKNIHKYLFFEDGFLIFTKSNQSQELLGEILFKIGKISNEVFSEIDQYIDPMHTVGKLLIKSGHITKKDLHNGLMYQMREVTLNIFPFFEGKFKFQEKKGFIEKEFKSKICIPDLIEEGIRRIKYNPYLKKFMEKKVPFPNRKDFLDRLTKKEKEVLEKIDGSSSTEALLNSSGFHPELFWQTLYLFYCLGLIDIEEVKVEEKISVKKEKAKKVAYDDSEKKIAEVVALRESLSSMDYYQILNVSQTASQKEIKTAYFQMARKYHPDHFDRDLPSGIKEKIEDVFSHVTSAYNTLSSEKKKREYDSRSETPSELEKKELEKKAEVKFRQGKTLYNRERYEEALVLLVEAVRLRRQNGSYVLLLAMLESKIPSFHEKAEEDFLNAIKLKPWNPEAYVELGLFYKKEGLLAKARRQFKKVLEMDPEHKIALKEFDLDGKPEKKKGLKGIFSFGARGNKKKKKRS